MGNTQPTSLRLFLVPSQHIPNVALLMKRRSSVRRLTEDPQSFVYLLLHERPRTRVHVKRAKAD
jgi:hypothetical protein